AEMCNDAARKAVELGASVLFFADADTWVPADQLALAVETARETGRLTHAFDGYHRLDSTNTRLGMRTDPQRIRVARYAAAGKRFTNHVSGATAVPLQMWRRVGGFDERFVGWGFEDQVFHLACEVLGGGTERVPGPAIH